MLACKLDPKPFKKRYISFSLTVRINAASCTSPFNIRQLVGLVLSSSVTVLIDMVLAALLWYDYALTWTREVRYFWTKRFTLSTLLYVLCRYGMLANILYTLALADKLPTMRVRFEVLIV